MGSTSTLVTLKTLRSPTMPKSIHADYSRYLKAGGQLTLDEWKKLPLRDAVDNGTAQQNVWHVFKSDFQGNIGRDCCLEMFGEEDEECKQHNAKLDTHG